MSRPPLFPPRLRPLPPSGWLLLLLALLGGGTGVGHAQESETVMIGEEPVFTVAALDTVNAILRARRIEERLRDRLATDQPLAPLRVAGTDTGALILVAGDSLVSVTRRDAEIASARSLTPETVGSATRALASEWAEALRTAFGRVAEEERERVVLQGLPLFEVGGTPELRAARRAAAIGIRVGQFAATPGELPAIRAVERGEGAVVLGGDEVLAEVSAAEAEAREMTPLALAREWAGEIEGAVGTLRQEQTWPFVLRITGQALAAALIATLIHQLLRHLARRLDRKSISEEGLAGSLSVVAARWAVSLVQLFLWIALAVLILWLIPGTRPLVYLAVDRGVNIVRAFTGWMLREGLVVALILVVTVLIARFVGAVVRHLVLAFGLRQGGRVALRASTLSGTIAGGVQLLILFIGLLSMLATLDFDPVPLLASAGVAGIALGFGVQTLIRDFFTGFFILLEDQYGVGDVIRVGTTSGKVERLTLRITQIRGLDGSLTSIPNGEILSVTNLSKDWAQVVLDVNIALGEDVDRATAVIAKTAQELAARWPDRVRGEAEVLGVETVDAAARAVTIRTVIKTAPGEQWKVSRELRRRLVDAFEEEEIEAPPRSAFAISDETGRAGP